MRKEILNFICDLLVNSDISTDDLFKCMETARNMSTGELNALADRLIAVA